VKSSKKKSRKYIAIVKLGNNTDGTAHCVKYRFDNAVKFTQYLDLKWPGWKWFNIYSNRSPNKGEQITSYTKFNKPK
jgi:hypothetical protein